MQSSPIFKIVVAGLAGLICLGLIIFGVLQLVHHDDSSKPTASQSASSQDVQSDKSNNKSPASKSNSTDNSSAAPKPGTDSQSAGDTNKSAETGKGGDGKLADTGPEQVIALFVGVSGAATVAARLYLARQRRLL